MNASRLRHLAIVLGLATLLGLLAPLGTSAAMIPDDDPGSPAHLSSLALTLRLFDAVLNDLDADAAEELAAADAVIQTHYGTFTGPQGLIDYATAVRQVYPDASFEITNVTVRGDSLEVSWLMSASQVRRAEQVFDFDIVLEGATTIAVDNSQITSVSQENAVVSAGSPQDVVVTQRGVNY